MEDADVAPNNDALSNIDLKSVIPMTSAEVQQVKKAIKLQDNLPTKQLPKEPVFPPGTSASKRISIIQKFISSFEYNYTGVNYFNVSKKRPPARICEQAKEIIREALPIKCIEAVFMGIYLTQGMEDLVRVPIGFKSKIDGSVFRHIVLGIFHSSSGRWGCLGLSRRNTLMYKDLRFETLGDLIKNFIEAYEECLHTVSKVRVGVPVNHNILSYEKICWRYLHVTLTGKPWDKAEAKITNHGKSLSKAEELWKAGSQAKADARGSCSSESDDSDKESKANDIRTLFKDRSKRKKKSKKKSKKKENAQGRVNEIKNEDAVQSDSTDNSDSESDGDDAENEGCPETEENPDANVPRGEEGPKPKKSFLAV